MNTIYDPTKTLSETSGPTTANVIFSILTSSGWNTEAHTSIANWWNSKIYKTLRMYPLQGINVKIWAKWWIKLHAAAAFGQDNGVIIR